MKNLLSLVNMKSLITLAMTAALIAQLFLPVHPNPEAQSLFCTAAPSSPTFSPSGARPLPGNRRDRARRNRTTMGRNGSLMMRFSRQTAEAYFFCCVDKRGRQSA